MEYLFCSIIGESVGLLARQEDRECAKDFEPGKNYDTRYLLLARTILSLVMLYSGRRLFPGKVLSMFITNARCSELRGNTNNSDYVQHYIFQGSFSDSCAHCSSLLGKRSIGDVVGIVPSECYFVYPSVVLSFRWWAGMGFRGVWLAFARDRMASLVADYCFDDCFQKFRKNARNQNGNKCSNEWWELICFLSDWQKEKLPSILLYKNIGLPSGM